MTVVFPIVGFNWRDFKDREWVKGIDEGVAGVGGWRYQRSPTHMHRGIDLSAPLGTPLVAVVDGWARFLPASTDAAKVGFHYGGNRVELTSVNGYGFKYFHLGSSMESQADAWPSFVSIDSPVQVKAGDVVGYLGYTGGSVATGLKISPEDAHLHFEYYPGGLENEDANPAHFFNQFCR